MLIQTWQSSIVPIVEGGDERQLVMTRRTAMQDAFPLHRHRFDAVRNPSGGALRRHHRYGKAQRLWWRR